MAGFALGIGTLLYLDRLEFWHLLVSTFAQGGIFGMLAPAWQSIIPEIVSPNRLINAAQLGTFAIGMASEAAGARVAFAGMGLALLLMSLWFAVWFVPTRSLH